MCVERGGGAGYKWCGVVVSSGGDGVNVVVLVVELQTPRGAVIIDSHPDWGAL